MILAGMSVGCGYSEEEYQAQVHGRERAEADLKAAQEADHGRQIQVRLGDGAAEKLKSDLKKLGVDLDAAKTKPRSSKQAMRRVQSSAPTNSPRSRSASAISSRASTSSTPVGLKVVVRNNRMVIQLPGDVLFDSGKDELKPQGKEVLVQVAEVIRSDSTSRSATSRSPVTPTTRSTRPAGAFKDNWGLSLARARQVLLFLTAPLGDKTRRTRASKAAAGSTRTTGPRRATARPTRKRARSSIRPNDEMGHNRRVELVLQPNVEEMLNISTIN